MLDHAGGGVEHDEAYPEAFGAGMGEGFLVVDEALDEVEAARPGEATAGEFVEGAVAAETGEVGRLVMEDVGELFRVGLGFYCGFGGEESGKWSTECGETGEREETFRGSADRRHWWKSEIGMGK